MKKLIVLALAICGAAAVNAEEIEKAKFSDNLYVSAGAGFNSVLDNGNFTIGGLATDISITKYLVEGFAMRLSYLGFENKTDDTYSWFSGNDKFGFHYPNIAWIWDPVETFAGFKDCRFKILPQVTAGALITTYAGKANAEFAASAGLEAQLRIAGPVYAFAKAQAIFAREEAYRSAGGKVISFPSVTAGITVSLGRKGFKKSTVVKEVSYETIVKTVMTHQVDTVIVPEIVNDLESESIVYFDLDKDFVSDREKAHVEHFLSGRYDKSYTLTIVGHADKETGNPRHNLGLSKRRVENVKKALAELGFEGEVVTDYKGDTANPFDGREKNRCVTICLL